MLNLRMKRPKLTKILAKTNHKLSSFKKQYTVVETKTID